MATREVQRRKRTRAFGVLFSATLVVQLFPDVARAQLGRPTTPERAESTAQPGMNETELSKRHQDPTSDLVSVPVPLTFDLGEGVGRTRYTASVNPFIPVNVTDDVRMIATGSLPITSAPAGVDERNAGLGDMRTALMFAPNRNRNFNFAIGPSFIIPTATSAELGTRKWSAGPAAAVSMTNGPVVYGGVASFHWSVAGAEARKDVSQLTLQPFAFYNFTDGWAVGATPTITANFGESIANVLTLPLGGGIYKTVKPDPSGALNLSVQAYANALSPDNGPDAQIRFVVAGLFPQ